MVIHFSFVRVLHCEDYMKEGLCCSLIANAEVIVTKVLMGWARMHVTCKGQNLPQKFNASQYSIKKTA